MIDLVSKLLPLALLPLSLFTELLLVGLIGRWRWPVIAELVLLWVCSLGLVSQTLWSLLDAPLQRTPTAKHLPSRRLWCSAAANTPLSVRLG